MTLHPSGHVFVAAGQDSNSEGYPPLRTPPVRRTALPRRVRRPPAMRGPRRPSGPQRHLIRPPPAPSPRHGWAGRIPGRGSQMQRQRAGECLRVVRGLAQQMGDHGEGLGVVTVVGVAAEDHELGEARHPRRATVGSPLRLLWVIRRGASLSAWTAESRNCTGLGVGPASRPGVTRRTVAAARQCRRPLPTTPGSAPAVPPAMRPARRPDPPNRRSTHGLRRCPIRLLRLVALRCRQYVLLRQAGQVEGEGQGKGLVVVRGLAQNVGEEGEGSGPCGARPLLHPVA